MSSMWSFLKWRPDFSTAIPKKNTLLSVGSDGWNRPSMRCYPVPKQMPRFHKSLFTFLKWTHTITSAKCTKQPQAQNSTSFKLLSQKIGTILPSSHLWLTLTLSTRMLWAVTLNSMQKHKDVTPMIMCAWCWPWGRKSMKNENMIKLLLTLMGGDCAM